MSTLGTLGGVECAELEKSCSRGVCPRILNYVIAREIIACDINRCCTCRTALHRFAGKKQRKDVIALLIGCLIIRGLGAR